MPRGLDHDGTIVREGALDRVPAAFAPVVDAARTRIAEAFGEERLHSAYLFGSIPRGTAVPGVSDLDLMLALRHEPAEADRADAKAVETALDGEFPQIVGAAVGMSSARMLLSEFDRYDGGFFVACLCTPLLGDDLAKQLPRFRPTSLLARETNGDLALVLESWRDRAAKGADPLALGRSMGRRLVRTGFTLVMPRWGGWTSDLAESTVLFGQYYPERAEQMRVALASGRAPTGDRATLDLLLEDLGPWLAAEYAAVHGIKAPRP